MFFNPVLIEEHELKITLCPAQINHNTHWQLGRLTKRDPEKKEKAIDFVNRKRLEQKAVIM